MDLECQLGPSLAQHLIHKIQQVTSLSPGGMKDAKSISTRIAEAYRSFGVGAFGFNMSYDKSTGISSQPVLVPSPVLGHHLEDLTMLIQEMGFKYGILVQLNNLDVY